MRGHGGDVQSRAQAHPVGEIGQHGPELGARFGQRGKQFVGQAEHPLEFAIPPTVDAEQPGGGGIGTLGRHPPRQPVADQVGHQQRRIGHVEHAVESVGDQLEHGVEVEELQPVTGVDPILGEFGVHGPGRPCASRVPVVVRQAEQFAVPQQPVVDRPGVHADARQIGRRPNRLRQTRARVGEQPGKVPVHRGADAIPQVHRLVGEPVHLTHLQRPRPHLGQHHPTAGGAEVDRGERADALHRKKAAATPASTGTCKPVVWEKSDVHSANAAFAMFSGSTSRLSRVRWA